MRPTAKKKRLMSKKRKALRNRYEKQIRETDKNKQRSVKKILFYPTF